MSAPTSSKLPNAAAEGRLSHAILRLARTHRGHAAAVRRAMNPHRGRNYCRRSLFDRDGRTRAELPERVRSPSPT
ncbi:hypothetical protein GCM10027168_14790 [Streptomyces capparidis]